MRQHGPVKFAAIPRSSIAWRYGCLPASSCVQRRRSARSGEVQVPARGGADDHLLGFRPAPVFRLLSVVRVRPPSFLVGFGWFRRSRWSIGRLCSDENLASILSMPVAMVSVDVGILLEGVVVDLVVPRHLTSSGLYVKTLRFGYDGSGGDYFCRVTSSLEASLWRPRDGLQWCAWH